MIASMFCYQIFLHESSACSLLMRIEWLNTVFRNHLLNFNFFVDLDAYRTSLVFKNIKISVPQYLLL